MKQFLLLVALSGVANAADQSLTVAAKLQYRQDAPTSGRLTFDEARKLIADVLKDGHPLKNRNYLLHVVKYQDKELAVQEQHWYVYHQSGKNTRLWRELRSAAGWPADADLFKDSRVFGSANLALVYLHIVNGVPAATAKAEAEKLCAAGNEDTCGLFRERPPRDSPVADLCDQIRGDLNAIRAVWSDDPVLQKSCSESLIRMSESADDREKQSAKKTAQRIWSQVRIRKNVFDLATKGSNDLVGWNSQQGAAMTGLGGQLVEQGAGKLSSLSYRVEITKKVPQPVQNVKDIVGLALGAQSLQAVRRIDTKLMGFAAGALFDASYVPSTMDVTAAYKDADKSPEIGKNTFLNEKRYFYDFSLAVPVKTWNDFRYDRSDSSVTVKKIEKINVWALANVGYPRDLNKTHRQLIPVFVYGIPVTGQPLKHHLFGAAAGFNKFNFFAGVQLDRKTFVRDFGKPLSGGNVFPVWRTHLVYGVNFPVSTVVNALKQKAN